MDCYQEVREGGEEIRFGNTDLVIRENFTQASSQITAPNQSKAGGADPNAGASYFYFGNDLTQRGKVDSLIPGEQSFVPSRIEVWTFAPERH